MAIPVPVPVGPLPVDDAHREQAELLVAYIAQVMGAGTTGSTPGTSPLIVPDKLTTVGASPIHLDTTEKQLWYRNLALALSVWTSTSPPTPTPSTYDPIFSATCTSSESIGDLVYVAGPGRDVRTVDVSSWAKMPAVGCIISKATTTSCVVQTRGHVTGVFSGLTVGKIHFVSPTGRPTRTPITPMTAPIFLQAIGVAIDATTLDLSPSNTVTLLQVNP